MPRYVFYHTKVLSTFWDDCVQYLMYKMYFNVFRGCHGHDRMVVRSTTTYAISADHHWSCEFEPLSWQGVLDTTLCDKGCQ